MWQHSFARVRIRGKNVHVHWNSSKLRWNTSLPRLFSCQKKNYHSITRYLAIILSICNFSLGCLVMKIIITIIIIIITIIHSFVRSFVPSTLLPSIHPFILLSFLPACNPSNQSINQSIIHLFIHQNVVRYFELFSRISPMWPFTLSIKILTQQTFRAKSGSMLRKSKW